MEQSPETKIYVLEIKLKNLEAKAEVFDREIEALKQEITALKAEVNFDPVSAKQALMQEFAEEANTEEDTTPTETEPTEINLPAPFSVLDTEPEEKEFIIPPVLQPEQETTEPEVEEEPRDLFAEVFNKTEGEPKDEANQPEEEPVIPVPETQPEEEPILAAFKSDPKFKRVFSDNTTKEKEPFNIENFIGGNVLSKLGVLILIIGVGVFLKYAIDHNLISPLGRLILAYVAGGALIGVSYYLKAKYHTYSAVLFSGGAATAYFTTYIGYVFLEVVPQGMAFPLMLLITVYTVYESTRFDEEIIGIIGLVGAYAVPPLIGNGGGNVAVFFTYISIINVGVLILAFRKNWYRLNLTAFIVTWLVFIVWFANSYTQQFLTPTLAFAFVFFIIFQVTLLIHYTRQTDKYQENKALLLLGNALVFYLIGTAILQHNNITFLQKHIIEGFEMISLGQGVFTFVFSTLCLATGIYIAKDNKDDELVYLRFLGVGVYMFTFAIYLSFSDAWIPVLWAVQTTLLFILWQLPKFTNKVLGSAAKALPMAVVFVIPFTFHFDEIPVVWTVEAVLLFAVAKRWEVKIYNQFSAIIAVLIIMAIPVAVRNEWMLLWWAAEAAVLFTVAKVWKDETYNWLTLGIMGLIAVVIPLLIKDHWIVFWWSIEVGVVFSIARIWKDVRYDAVATGIFLLIAAGIEQTFSNTRVPLGWAIETGVIFALSRIFIDQQKIYDTLSAGLALLLGYGIAITFDGEARIWWWLFESVVMFALGHFFKSAYLKYVNYVLVVVSVFDTMQLWQQTYLYPSATLGFVFNHVFLVSIALIVDILGMGYIHTRFKEVRADLEVLFKDIPFNHVFDVLGALLLYGLFFGEIYHYFISQTPVNESLTTVSLLLYSMGYVTLLAGVVSKWLPVKNFALFLFAVSGLLAVLTVTLGFWNLDQIHFKYATTGYIWLRWGAYALLTFMLWINYKLIQQHQLLAYQQIQTWFIIGHVLAVITLSFELVSLAVLYGGLKPYEARHSVYKLGFTLIWSIYSVILIAFGIAKRLKYLRLTGFAFLAITLLKLFANDINYNSTLNVILAFISIGVLLLITAFLYQKYKHIIMADDLTEETAENDNEA